AGGLRSKGAWSVFTPLAEAHFLQPFSTDPTDTLTVFIHEDLTKASAFAEMQLRELGFDLEANRCGENRVAEGYLVDLCRGSTPGDCSPEFANHLVEDESLVDSILNDEARVCVLEHIAELVELFDLCICIGFSLGIDKLVLLKPQVKSLGEIVGRHGRSPDPAKVAALSEWGPIGSLKQLQEFLGTANYSRDQIGPKFAVAMDPLRRYLREGDKAFPMTPRGLEAVERLKRLMRKATCLAVPDERAAANGSRPYEQLADCCKAGLGGAHLQMSADLRRWNPLAYHAESLSAAQTLWHPFRQEQHAQLKCRRKFRSLFGSIPVVMYTDHANNVRLQDKPLDQIDPVSFRTCSELTADGSEIRNLSGRSMKLADGLSRLFETTGVPAEQEQEMLKRLERRTQELWTAHARLCDPDCDDFLEFPEPEPEPKKVTAAEVAKGQELVSDQVQTAAEGSATLHPPVGLIEDGLRSAGVNSVVIASASPFTDDDNFGYWVDVKGSLPTAAAYAGGCSTGSTHRAAQLVAFGRRSCASRARVHRVELTDARNTWVAIEGFIGGEPSIQGTYTDVAFLCQAVPDTFEPQRKLRPGVLVAPTQGQQRAVSFWNRLGEVLAFLRVPSLSEAVPFRENLYSASPKRLEDEGLAFCVVCGKKAQLHRCGMCGGPIHLTCLPEAEGGVAHPDIACGPCAALRCEKPATMAVAEVSLSYEERLLDPEEEEGDDSWTRLKGSSKELALERSMGYEKRFLLQGLFHRAGERPNWIKEMWAETGAGALSDGPLELPFKPGEGRGMPLPMDPKLEQHTLGPWMDVYVDFTGPYTESDGHRYACKLLRVPILEPCRSLKRGEDPAGPSAYGSGNGGDVHKACASEWARVLPLVHYIMMNTPILESGLVPRDLDREWSLRDHVERELVPFRAPGQLPVDEWAKAVFRNFKTIESTLSRYLSMTEERRAELYDRGHLKRDWTIGER
ncbi:pol, partial [Symbiodinium microadriaticum]